MKLNHFWTMEFYKYSIYLKFPFLNYNFTRFKIFCLPNFLFFYVQNWRILEFFSFRFIEFEMFRFFSRIFYYDENLSQLIAESVRAPTDSTAVRANFLPISFVFLALLLFRGTAGTLAFYFLLAVSDILNNDARISNRCV